MRNKIHELELRLAASKFNVEEALKEVQEKKEEEIEIETAYKWASRSIACYKLYEKTKELKWFIQAEDYFHECLEHASLAKDMGETLKIIESEVKKYRVKLD